jgi:hypothetical protein
MNTATLTRPALRALPGPAKGALVAPQHDPRPCVTNPIGWWDTGDRNNQRAIALCHTCPALATCGPKFGEERPRGVIQGGVPYDERGRKARLCRSCSKPLARGTDRRIVNCDGCRRGRLASVHTRIAELVDAGASWAVIGRAVGYHGDTVRKYWIRWQKQQGIDVDCPHCGTYVGAYLKGHISRHHPQTAVSA